MERPWQDEETLRRLYWEEQKSTYEIAEELDCAPRTVRDWMNNHEIERRSTSKSTQRAQSGEPVTELHDKAWLKEEYHTMGKSISEIANDLECGTTTVDRWLDRHGIEKEKPPQEKPVTFHTDEDGYERWRHGKDTYHTISVHRLAAVAWFGFEEIKDKDIHHVDEVPFDNREENLQPMTRSDHMSYHARKRADT